MLQRWQGTIGPMDKETVAEYPSNLLEGMHLLVTGGGSGLGRSMACDFSSLGAKVSICGRRRGPVDETAGLIEEAGGTAMALTCDVKDSEAVETCIDEAESALGPVTGLLNNAAGNFLSSSETLGDRGWDAVVKTNLYGTFHMTRACGKRWIERKSGGVVLSIATTYAESGSAFVLPSATSKAGVVTLTRSLAVEWGRHGIRLNCIAPGPIPTKGAWERLIPTEKHEEALKASIPLGRFGTREDLGRLAIFLLSNLSSYITGQNIVMDGGAHLATGGMFNALVQRPEEETAALFASLRPTPRDEADPSA